MWVMANLYACFCGLIFHITSVDASGENATVTAQVQQWDDPLLLVSTLDGLLHAVGQKTGYLRWRMRDEPVVKVPVESSNSITPFFLPDPRDGSLYMLWAGQQDGLKKLPFTIPQLVASSPCRSSDGILYTGKKSDTWYAVDPNTGYKEEIISFNNVEKMCPLSNSDSLLFGRTEYNILMYDSKMKARRWNVSFYDYSSSSMDPQQLNNYGLVHFTASSTGHALTLDRQLGLLLWEHDFQSPVTAVYMVEGDGLVSVPFTSVAEETLHHLRSSLASRRAAATSDMQLYPTLYIGQHVHGLYALLSLVDKHTPTLSVEKPAGRLLLEGPAHPPTSPVPTTLWTHGFPVPGNNVRLSPKSLELPSTFRSLPRHRATDAASLVVLGHYSLPESSKVKTTLQITGRSDTIIYSAPRANLSWMGSVGVQLDGGQGQIGTKAGDKLNLSFVMSRDFLMFSYHETKAWINQQENKGLKLLLVILCGCMFTMFWYFRMQVREFHNLSHLSRGSSSGSHRHDITAVAEEMPCGLMRVGKIIFNVEQVLGKGCEGTFVYKGQFESRAVAVKRLLPECFTFADREVNLLQESDQHANVVRYFCMEQDKQFRYIALELCAATLQDYVEGRFDAGGMIAPLEILRQAAAGLQHLHSLDIVHRDIKPHNVLISLPNAVGEVRAMISDFGLCKKLKVGRMSFSRRSGVTGTDGWIAPEMMVGNTRTTCAVDIFSFGCVIYYVMSGGKHPFGDVLRRQANILSGELVLDDLNSANSLLCHHLVSMMIRQEPAERPPSSAVLKHPVFWSEQFVLAFLLDVSDRIERDEEDSPVVQSLESNSSVVVREDWRHCIDAAVAQDLRKYRNYRGSSVRDLLRALRNKKHHYRELSEEAQRSLGEIPGEFVEYWTTRFPLLVLHSWLTMQCVRAEPMLAVYYHEDYVFQGTTPELVSCSWSGLPRRHLLNSPCCSTSLPSTDAPGRPKDNHPVGKWYISSAPKWCSRRVAELKLQYDRSRSHGPAADGSSSPQCAIISRSEAVDVAPSLDIRFRMAKRKCKKNVVKPVAWKVHLDDT